MTADQTTTDSHLAARCAAVASIGAGVIHAAVMPAHWSDWVPSGLFFAALACFQLGWAFAIWSRPTPLRLTIGLLVNVVAVALWVIVHTRGLPFGPNADLPEAVSGAGIFVLLLQCYAVMGATLAWSRRGAARSVPRFNRAVILFAANAVMAFAVTAGLVSALAGHQHHHDGANEAETERFGSVGPGLPVTDMGLHTGTDHHLG